MPSVSLLAAAFATALAVAVFLLGEKRQSRALRWIAKPLASTGFIAAALVAGAPESTYGRWVLAALVLSWLGDVLLLSSGKGGFLAGLGAFLASHLAFAGAFAARGVVVHAAALAAIVSVVPAVVIARWLLPHVDAKMRVPVIAYMVAISTMVALAVGTTASAVAPALVAGAIAFYLSDISVARDRFVAPGFVNRAWGIPLYYGAQLLLAWSTSPAP